MTVSKTSAKRTPNRSRNSGSGSTNPGDLVSGRPLRCDRRVLNGIDLSVEQGDRLLIRGPSGAGKTTLFNVLGLLELPTAGTLTVDGEPAAELPERDRARMRREHVGIVYQEFRLVPDLTVRESVQLPQEHAGAVDETWVDTLLDRLGIAALAGRYPPTLSGGEKGRVAVARALANRPAVVLADEPTGNLDPETADQVIDLLLDARGEADTALVVVSHDRSLGDHFERTLRIEDGALASV